MERSIGASLTEIFDVRGKRTLITGGASGLGLAMAEAMLDAGARVTVADIDDERLERAANSLDGRAGPLRVRRLDVTVRGAVRTVVEEIVADLGGLDVAFVNAGIAVPSPAHEGELDGLDDPWDRVMAVNLTGAFATLQACAAPMRTQRSGRIVVTTSTAGLRADPMVSNSYVASKAALVNLTRQAALELAPHGVHVNAIAPGPFHTNIGAPAGQRARPRSADDEVWNRTVPLGRMGEPAELKGLALLLASPASSFITGAVYAVDGGALVNYPR